MNLSKSFGDPDVNRVVLVGYGKGIRLLSYELCDACEADSLGYMIDGVLVSDFVTRSWFEPNGDGPYDFCKHLKHPLQIAPGGYIGVLDIVPTGKVAWKSIFARGETNTQRHTEPGARRVARYSNALLP